MWKLRLQGAAVVVLDARHRPHALFTAFLHVSARSELSQIVLAAFVVVLHLALAVEGLAAGG